jgi:hypothetical protein
MPVESALRSSSERTTVRPGAAGIGSSDGTANTWQPAASADATPFGESSSAAHRSADTPSSLAARRYGSGSGLVWITSFAQTVTSKLRPVLSSTASIKLRSDEVTSACGSPAALTCASSDNAPGWSGTPWVRTRCSMPVISQSAITAGDTGRVAFALR